MCLIKPRYCQVFNQFMKYDITFALTKEIIVALLGAMNSVVSNTAKPKQIRINITVPVAETVSVN